MSGSKCTKWRLLQILSMLTPMLMLNWPQCSPMKIDIEKLTQRMNRDGMLPLRSRLEKILKSSTRQVEMSDNLLHEVRTMLVCVSVSVCVCGCVCVCIS